LKRFSHAAVVRLGALLLLSESPQHRSSLSQQFLPWSARFAALCLSVPS